MFNPNTQEETVQHRISKIAEVATKHNGELQKREIWGRRSLAYPINNYKYGLFVAANLTGESTVIADLNRQLHLMDEVLRSFVVTKNAYSPDLDGRLKSDFTYGYRPPQSQFGSKTSDSDGADDDDNSDSDDSDTDGKSASV